MVLRLGDRHSQTYQQDWLKPAALLPLNLLVGTARTRPSSVRYQATSRRKASPCGQHRRPTLVQTVRPARVREKAQWVFRVVLSVLDSVAGFGPLPGYLDDPQVEELWINGPGKVFVARNGQPEFTSTILLPDDLRDLVERMLKTFGRRVDLGTPFVDAMLPDGSRLRIVIPDVSREHWAVNIRKFVVRASRLDELVGLGTLTAHAAEFLDAAVVARIEHPRLRRDAVTALDDDGRLSTAGCHAHDF